MQNIGQYHELICHKITVAITKSDNGSLGLKLDYLWIFNDLFCNFSCFMKINENDN